MSVLRLFLTSSRILFFMLLMSISAAIHAGELEENIDRVGMDYRRITLPAALPYLCQGECVDDDRCRSFTYVKPTIESQEPICYLKEGEPTPQPNDCCTSGLRPSVTHALANSEIYKASQASLTEIIDSESMATDPTDALLSGDRVTAAAAAGDKHDTLINYAKKCDAATGIRVPAFKCANGVLIPEQGNIPATNPNATFCNRPDVLHGYCDPGSRFLVLPGRTTNAVAVALCRKVGRSITSNRYDDIAVIQHNKKNGATCFYQALDNLSGNVPSPRAVKVAGTNSWQSGGNGWMSPRRTEAIGCTGCHDNGAFIRSPYLAQLTKKPHALPNSADGFNNLNTPYKFVGLDYATNRTWSVRLASPNNVDYSCIACHRLAVSNITQVHGSSAEFAVVSTQVSQYSKNPHSLTSPIWMAPGQTTFDVAALASAQRYKQCVDSFYTQLVSSPDSAYSAPGCIFEPLGRPF